MGTCKSEGQEAIAKWPQKGTKNLKIWDSFFAPFCGNSGVLKSPPKIQNKFQ
jgi:hypothetical protein